MDERDDLRDGVLAAFDLTDLERWREQGLISADQVREISRYAGAEGVEETPMSSPSRRARRLDVASIAYYFGGFMILFAYTIFMGIQWEAVGKVGQVLIASMTISLLWGLGALLRRRGYSLGGNMLVFVGTGIVPLWIYTVEHLIGVWPRIGEDYEDFFRDVQPSWVSMELGAIAVAAVVLWKVRFSLIGLLISFWAWYLSMDFARWIFGGSARDWGSTAAEATSCVIGLGLIGLGVALQRRLGEDISLWFYLFGHLAVICPFTALALEHKTILGLLAFPAFYAGVVVASVWLQRKVFLVFGAIGIYGYVSYLASEIFHGALGFTFGLALVGLVIIFSAVWYQKSARQSLERFFERHPLSTGPALDAAAHA
jgi:hypothetical protein